jgi:type I restriction enzyme, R subunit
MNEHIVEQAAVGWFEALGYRVARGADISPGADDPWRTSYEDVVLLSRLNAALRRLNPDLPEDAIVQVRRQPFRVRPSRRSSRITAGSTAC